MAIRGVDRSAGLEMLPPTHTLRFYTSPTSRSLLTEGVCLVCAETRRLFLLMDLDLGMPAVPFPHRTAMSLDNYTALESEHTDGTHI